MHFNLLILSIIVMIISFIAIVVSFELKSKADTTSQSYKTYNILYWVAVAMLLAGFLSAGYAFFRERSSAKNQFSVI